MTLNRAHGFESDYFLSRHFRGLVGGENVAAAELNNSGVPRCKAPRRRRRATYPPPRRGSRRHCVGRPSHQLRGRGVASSARCRRRGVSQRGWSVPTSTRPRTARRPSTRPRTPTRELRWVFDRATGGPLGGEVTLNRARGFESDYFLSRHFRGLVGGENVVAAELNNSGVPRCEAPRRRRRAAYPPPRRGSGREGCPSDFHGAAAGMLRVAAAAVPANAARRSCAARLPPRFRRRPRHGSGDTN